MTGHQSSRTGKLFEQLQNYVMLQKEYYKLDLLEKGSLFLSHALLIFGGLLLGCFCLLCLSFALAYLLGAWLQSFVIAFLLVAAIYIILILILFHWKEKLVINPIIKMLAKALFKSQAEDETTKA